jgi:metal-responsive CopG/Arc/MetJ family transcriptional regulator
MKSIVKTISFDAEILEWVDYEARQRHTNRSQVVREAIAELMRTRAEVEDRQAQKGVDILRGEYEKFSHIPNSRPPTEKP